VLGIDDGGGCYGWQNSRFHLVLFPPGDFFADVDLWEFPLNVKRVEGIAGFLLIEAHDE